MFATICKGEKKANLPTSAVLEQEEHFRVSEATDDKKSEVRPLVVVNKSYENCLPDPEGRWALSSPPPQNILAYY